MPIPFLDLRAVHDPIMDDFLEDVKEIFSTSQFILGPHVQRFEEAMAKYIGVKHALAVNSGTDALLLALNSLDIGPGDEVICPTYTFAACGDVIVRLGATPVFVDSRADTFNLDPDKTLASITSRTKAILAVHLFGQACEIDRLTTIARTYSVPVIEDVCQATGGRVHNRKLGTFGHFGAFSFYPTKNLGCAGDGGLITTNDDERIDVLRKYRDHGRVAGYIHDTIGYNSRLSSIQAALLLRKLPDLDENNAERIENARLYTHLFEGSPVLCPKFKDDMSHVYNIYTVLVPERDRLIEKLKELGIGCAVYYPVPLHMQPCFGYLNYKEGAFPIAEDLARRAIALPVSPGLKKHHIEEIAKAVLSFYGAAV